MESEKELLDDINSGSRAALHRLYERYVGYAMAVALRYIPMRDDAEDVVQDSFIKVFSGMGCVAIHPFDEYCGCKEPSFHLRRLDVELLYL